MGLAAPDGPPKFCPRCKQTKPRKAFDGRTHRGRLYAVSYCHPCAVEYARDYQRPRHAALWKRIKADPEWRATRAAQEADRRRRLGIVEAGTPYKPRRRGTAPAGAQTSRLIDGDLFAAWLLTLGDSTPAIGLACGLPHEQVRLYLKGGRKVTLAVADRACVAAGVNLSEVLP